MEQQHAVKTLAAIDKAIEDNQESSNRTHLGASVIGRSCPRQLWYLFRWAYKEQHEARILRLFNRGHLEEHRIVKWLKDAGIHVWEYDGASGKQIRIEDCEGHFGGSLDGVAINIPDLDKDELCLTEFKTHGDKSFKLLVKNGVEKSKPEHVIQMWIYMFKKGLNWGLYIAINKNTDALHIELIYKNDECAQRYIGRARSIIYSDEAPLRINDSSSWFECKFCSYSEICHGMVTPNINCRTCAHSTPVKGGDWSCQLNILAPKDKGCDEHLFNPHIVNLHYIGAGKQPNTIEFQLPENEILVHGPTAVTSKQLQERFSIK